MKNFKRILCLIALLVSAFLLLNAQSQYAKIDRNRNIQAEGLFHDLNVTKDTLILQSDKKISYLYSINNDYGRELDFYIDATSYKLPLNKLSKGKHVFVAVQSPLRIVFVVHVLQDIPKDQPVTNTQPKRVAIRPTELASNAND